MQFDNGLGPMELSKAFDSIPHDFLIAELYAYVLSIDPIKLFYSYFKKTLTKCQDKQYS